MAYPPRRKVPPELIASWKAEQLELRKRLVVCPLPGLPRYIAAADAAFLEAAGLVVAVALVWDRQRQQVVESRSCTASLTIPYVPTFLSFREGPAVSQAISGLRHPFEVVCFDGQGYAHPRRCGLATHLGVSLDLPSIGCAKSRLIGQHKPLAEPAGSRVELVDAGEVIGTVLRTRDGKNPIFVSVGHRVDLRSAVRVVRSCCTRYRIPEPTRLADIEVSQVKRTL